GGFRESKPAPDTALTGRVAVVVDNALAPGAAECRVGCARQNDRVLDWNDALVVIAVQSPSLKLSPAETAVVHHPVKRMFMVIAFLAHRTQLRAQLAQREHVFGARF